jgi:hypothetical protein
MKKQLTTIIIAAFVGSPLAFSQQKDAGKESDSTTNKSQPASPKAPGAGATKGTDPAKASDAVTEKAPSREFEGKITATNKEAMTVTVEDKKNTKHTVHIGSTTKVKKGGAEAKFSDIMVGESVRGTCVKKGDASHAETLIIGG